MNFTVYRPSHEAIRLNKFYPEERFVFIDAHHVAVWVEDQLIQADRPFNISRNFINGTNEEPPTRLFASESQVQHIQRERLTLPFCVQVWSHK